MVCGTGKRGEVQTNSKQESGQEWKAHNLDEGAQTMVWCETGPIWINFIKDPPRVLDPKLPISQVCAGTQSLKQSIHCYRLRAQGGCGTCLCAEHHPQGSHGTKAVFTPKMDRVDWYSHNLTGNPEGRERPWTCRGNNLEQAEPSVMLIYWLELGWLWKSWKFTGSEPNCFELTLAISLANPWPFLYQT